MTENATQSEPSVTLEVYSLASHAKQLQEGLTMHCSTENFPIDLPRLSMPRFRAPESVLVAAVQVSGSVLSRLLAAVFALSHQHGYKKVVIRDGDKTVEVPMEFLLRADSTDRLSDLVKLISEMERPQIHLVQ